MRVETGNKCLGFAGLGSAVFFMVACSVPKVETTRPISTNRSTETLERIEGELPQWKKSGSLSVSPDNALWPDDTSTAVVMVRDNQSTQTISAKGRDVTIECSDSSLTIVGECPRLLVTGQGNQIRCDFVDEVLISGDRNRLQFDSVVSGEVSGGSNTISWKKPVNDARPNINYTGINNSLERIEEIKKAPPRYTRSKKK